MSESTFQTASRTRAGDVGVAARDRSRTPATAVLRWLGRVVLSLLALVTVAAASVYGITEHHFRGRFTVPGHRIAVASDSATIAHGERAAADLHAVAGIHPAHG